MINNPEGELPSVAFVHSLEGKATLPLEPVPIYQASLAIRQPAFPDRPAYVVPNWRGQINLHNRLIDACAFTNTQREDRVGGVMFILDACKPSLADRGSWREIWNFQYFSNCFTAQCLLEQQIPSLIAPQAKASISYSPENEGFGFTHFEYQDKRHDSSAYGAISAKDINFKGSYFNLGQHQHEVFSSVKEALSNLTSFTAAIRSSLPAK